MNALQITLALLLPPLVLASIFCSASETAIFSLTHRERARLRSMSPAAYRAALQLLQDPPSVLVTVLVLNNTVNVLYFVVTSVLARDLSPAWLGLAVSAGSLLALILVGEILPKLLSRRDPARWSRWLVRPLLACFLALGPVRRFIAKGLVAPLTRLVRADHRGSGAISVDELSELLEVSAREGELESGEEQLLGDVVELGSIRVREIMTPRVEIPFLEASASAGEAAEAVSKSGRTEIPVLSGPEGDVVGVLDAHRLLAARAIAQVSSGMRPEPRPQDFLEPALFVPELSRLDQLLDEFRRSGRGIAVCVDEHGTIVGLVEVSDVVRRLVGEGSDERGADHPAIERIGNGQWVVPGSLRLGDLGGLLDEETAGEAPPRAVVTVAGLVLHRLGRVPRAGDRVRVRNLELEVQAMEGRRIERVLMSVVEEPAAAAGAGA